MDLIITILVFCICFIAGAIMMIWYKRRQYEGFLSTPRALNEDEVNDYIVLVLKSFKRDMSLGYDFGAKKYFVDYLLQRYDPTVIRENLNTSGSKAYVVEKGKEFVICLRAKKEDLKFVILHEMSHIGSHNQGHDDEFWNNFQWLLHYAFTRGIYSNPKNYAAEPSNYCGLEITENPFYWKHDIDIEKLYLNRG